MPTTEIHSTDISNQLWDWRSVLEAIPDGKDFDFYSEFFAWYKAEGDLGQKDAYRFLHHEIDENGDVGAANLQGCWGCIAALNTGNCPAPIEEDRQGIYDHISGHLADADIKAPPLQESGANDMSNLIDIKGYKIKAKTQEAEVWIYEEIGAGWFGGLSAKQFADDIKALGKVNQITVRLNSPGGDVFDGIAIYNVLKQNPARVVVNIDGLAASIASIIAMAGDEINMAGNATMMIHRAWGLSMGNAEEMTAMAATLAKLDNTLAATYNKRTGIDMDQVNELMQAETWMNSQEALEYGFVDTVTEELKLAAHFDLEKFKYRHNPLADKAGDTEPREADAPADIGEPMHPAEPKELNLEVFDNAIKRCESILA